MTLILCTKDLFESCLSHWPQPRRTNLPMFPNYSLKRVGRAHVQIYLISKLNWDFKTYYQEVDWGLLIGWKCLWSSPSLKLKWWKSPEAPRLQINLKRCYLHSWYKFKLACALTLDGMHPDALSLAAIQLYDFGSEKCVSNVFPSQFGIAEIWETLTLFVCLLLIFFNCFLCFETSPQLLKLLRRMLQCCFAVKLQKCFMDYATSPDFPSSWGWVDNDWI